MNKQWGLVTAETTHWHKNAPGQLCQSGSIYQSGAKCAGENAANIPVAAGWADFKARWIIQRMRERERDGQGKSMAAARTFPWVPHLGAASLDVLSWKGRHFRFSQPWAPPRPRPSPLGCARGAPRPATQRIAVGWRLFNTVAGIWYTGRSLYKGTVGGGPYGPARCLAAGGAGSSKTGGFFRIAWAGASRGGVAEGGGDLALQGVPGEAVGRRVTSAPPPAADAFLASPLTGRA